MQEINWYPGHMAKAKRQLNELIKYLDVILEIRDARVPLASHNDDLEVILERKPCVVILNKADLAEPKITKDWARWLRKRSIPVIELNAKSGMGVDEIWRLIPQIITVSKIRKIIRIGVIGIPNVGKSSLLNRLTGSSSAKTGNRPGITRGKQWVRRDEFEILDTPGLLPPKIKSSEDGFKLALIGTIREEIIPAYDLALKLLENYGERMLGRGKSGESYITVEEQLEWFARKRGFLLKGGAADLNRAVSILLKEFRDGKLGQFSLEAPPQDRNDG
jgi:ribosome biogenesis GTP-binding protein YlqF